MNHWRVEYTFKEWYSVLQHELSELDDIMPEFHKKEEAEKLVSEVKEDGKDEEKATEIREADSFLKNSQRDINITDEVIK